MVLKRASRALAEVELTNKGCQGENKWQYLSKWARKTTFRLLSIHCSFNCRKTLLATMISDATSKRVAKRRRFSSRLKSGPYWTINCTIQTPKVPKVQFVWKLSAQEIPMEPLWDDWIWIWPRVSIAIQKCQSWQRGWTCPGAAATASARKCQHFGHRNPNHLQCISLSHPNNPRNENPNLKKCKKKLPKTMWNMWNENWKHRGTAALAAVPLHIWSPTWLWPAPIKTGHSKGLHTFKNEMKTKWPFLRCQWLKNSQSVTKAFWRSFADSCLSEI